MRDEPRRLPPPFLRRIREILSTLEAATDLADLAALPGSYPLHGDRAGAWAVRESTNWRIVFRFKDGHASDVDLIDHHYVNQVPVPWCATRPTPVMSSEICGSTAVQMPPLPKALASTPASSCNCSTATVRSRTRPPSNWRPLAGQTLPSGCACKLTATSLRLACESSVAASSRDP